MSRPSESFIRRLITYYKTHDEKECLPIWTGTYAPLRQFIMNDDVEAIYRKLDSLYIDDLWGIDYNQQNSWGLNPYEQCFAECLKIISSELNTDSSVEGIERVTGMKLDIPSFPNRPTVKFGDRNIPLRFIVCYHILHCLRTHKTELTGVLEIGAGTGYFPYLFIENYPQINYNIIDLPIVSVMQSYIYATMVGENKVWFHGEQKTDSPLHIYSPDSINDLTTSIDVAINHNSFPELPRNVQASYLNKMKQLLKPDGFFYSVNWEPIGIDQTSMEFANESNGFERIHRRNFLLEKPVHHQPCPDYFEEIYKPK